jgi:hypothetical protein
VFSIRLFCKRERERERERERKGGREVGRERESALGWEGGESS